MELIINADIVEGFIHKDIYGHFAEHLGRCIYEGIWVGEDSPIPNTRGIRNDVIAALREIKIPVLRWPGGCFADEYHWKDGVGPYDKRSQMINVHWGGVIENNHFGTHEFLELCGLIGAEPYICGNVGSGTVQEMREWVEYLMFDGRSPMADWRRGNGRDKPWRVRFFGVGNENWGCGGNMRPEYYADLYRRYACYVRNFSGNAVYKIACGASGDDYRWTEVVMREAGRFMDGISLHHYTVPGLTWENKGSSLEFTREEWLETMRKAWLMDDLIIKHSAIMDQYDPQKRVGLIVDEWGTWHDVEPGTNPGFLYQQNTLRDALVAGLTLNIFNRHCNRIRMANIAQIVNVLQALILTEGAKIVLTPTYHVFDMYKAHQDSQSLATDIVGAEARSGDFPIPRFSWSASKNHENKIHVTLCNLDPEEDLELRCEVRGTPVSQIEGKILTGREMNIHNTFENPDRIKPIPINEMTMKDQAIHIKLPSKSVTVLSIS